MARWRYPSLSIHGIEGAFGESGWKSIIPGKVIGKFSIRIVPNQKADKVGDLIVDYIKNKWKLRGSANTMKVITIQHQTLTSPKKVENIKSSIQLPEIGSIFDSTLPLSPHHPFYSRMQCE